MSATNSAFILINSRDKLPGSVSNADFICLLTGFNNNRGDTHIALESAEFYDVQYPIRSGFNNEFRFNEGVAPGVYYTVVLTPGSYSAPEMASEIATLMTVLGTQTYSGTYNSITKQMTITAIIPDTWSFDSSTLLYPVNDYIGFPITNNTLVTGHVGTKPVNLSTGLYVDLELVNWENGNLHTGGQADIFHRIPLLGGYGDYVHYQNTDIQDFTLVTDEQLQKVHIRLLNTDGSLYEIPSNFEVSVTLRIESLE
jgi:hypothetical protein